MMNFFKKKPLVDDSDMNLTTLDIPDLINVPYLPHDTVPLQCDTTIHTAVHAHHKDGTQQTQFISRAPQDPSPTRSEFKKNLMKLESGIEGERERNVILEEQVKMLSYQASVALDKVNEMTKENDSLRLENQKLKLADNNSTSTDSRRLSSTTSLSTRQDSLFSNGQQNGMSQASSMQSLSKHLMRSSVYLDEMTTSYQKELNALRVQLCEMEEQLAQNNIIVQKLESQIDQLQKRIQSHETENMSLWKRLSQKTRSYDIELELYKTQMDALREQLQLRQQSDLQLRQRLMDYDLFKFTLNSARAMA